MTICPDEKVVIATEVAAVIIDDHPAVAAGVAEWCTAADPPVRLLDAEGRLARVHTEPGRSADVVILGLQLGTKVPRFRILKRLVDEGRKVVVYSYRTDQETMLHCLELGAATYLTKAEGKNHLIPAVRAAATDRPYTSPVLAAAMANASGNRPRLSARELEVLRAWFASDSKTLVGKQLHLSAKSVETYIARVRVKYANVGRAAPNKAALVARALQDGLVELDDL